MKLDLKKLFADYLDLINRLIPKPPRVPVVGIDIGTSAIKAVKMTEVGGVMELSSWWVERIEGGNVKDAIKNCLTNIHFDPEQVPVVSVSGKGTLIRYVDMPQMPIDELRKSFMFELDKYFPFEPQSIYTDCAILDLRPKEKKMSVLVVGVKKEFIDERMHLLKEAGAPASHITLNAIAIANAFEVSGPAVTQTNNAKAILDIGGAVSNLLVIKDLSPRFTRDIFIGSQEITQQIANILGVDVGQAEQMKRASVQDSPQVLEACEAAVSNLVGEIRLSLDYFMTEKNVQIDEVFLLGGGSLLKGIESVIEKNLGIPVKTWDPLAKVRLSPSIASSDIRNFSAQLGVAIGLGLTRP